ncbi:hypothetical protein [Caproiciproducens sp.]
MPIWDNIGGVYHKTKSYSNIGGVWVPDKKTYDNIAGVWRQSYSGAVEWTYQASVSGNGISKIYTYGVGEEASAYIGVDNTAQGDLDNTCAVLYTLKEPITIPAGSTVVINGIASLANYTSLVQFLLQFNGVQVWASMFGWTKEKLGIYTYTIPSTITVSSITVSVFTRISKANWNLCSAAVTINPLDGDSFLLNSTGKSN